jgi:hypothetical protein
MQFEIVPCELDDANAFVTAQHRHHPAVVGHKFSIAVVDESSVIRGVAIIGRPVARRNDDGFTLEVTRCCTDGTKNAASALYGAARRASFALGYRKLITYTLKTEPGTSLRAAGWKVVGEVKGRSWSVPSRPRVDKTEAQLQDKFRWEVSA